MQMKNFKAIANYSSSFCAVMFCGGCIYTVIKSGAWADDYSFLYAIQVDSADYVLLHNFREGRYLSGIFHYFGFSNVSTVTGLVALRIASFFGMLVTLLVIYKVNRKLFTKTQILYLLPLLFSLPVFSQYLSFATTWIGFWSLCLALVTTELLIRESRLFQSIGFLILISLYFFSQLLPFWVFAFLAFKFLAINSQLGEMLRLIFRILCLQLFAAITSQILRILINNQLSIEGSGRIGVVSIQDLPEKVFWFFSRVYVSILRPYQIGSPDPFEAFLTAGLMLVIILSLFTFVNKVSKPDKPARIIFLEFALLQALAILSLTPLLIWNQNQIELRLIGAGSFVTVSILWVSLLQIIDVERNVFLNFGLSSLVLLLVLLNVLRTFELRTVPFESKEKFITSSLLRCKESGREGQFFIKMPEGWPKRNLLGDYSVGTDLQMSWVPIPNVALSLKEVSSAKNEIELYTSTSLSRNQKECLIDFREYVNRNWTQLSHSSPLRHIFLDLISNMSFTRK
jgi:hypothetical protein